MLINKEEEEKEEIEVGVEKRIETKDILELRSRQDTNWSQTDN